MFYFMPIWFVSPQQTDKFFLQSSLHLQATDFRQNQSIPQMDKVISKENWQKYLNIFQEQLKILDQKQKKKIWQPDQDNLLLEMKEKDEDWKDIALKIVGTNSEICRRRYFRLRENNVRWPKEIDDQIKYLCEVKNMKWSMIVNELENKFEYAKKYTGKMVKERYEFYLKEGIQKKDWTVEEDIKLIELVSRQGTCWKDIIQKFEGRTELQLKNRYNGTLKLVEKRVLAKLQEGSKDTIQ